MEEKDNIGVVMHGAKAERINANRDRVTESALGWIAQKTGLDYFLLVDIFRRIDYSKITAWSMYCKGVIFGKSGKRRVVWEPIPELKLIQTKINEKILKENIYKHENSSGFAGGTILEAIEPHLDSKFMMAMDIVKAFPNTTHKKVLKNLITLPFPGKVPEVIAEICTFPVGINCELVAPQGAPTSPLLFELVMREIDEELAKRTKNVGIKYTRFADNFFFSGNDKQKLELMKNTFIGIISHSGYQTHKIRTTKLSGRHCRVLGLNIIDRKIYNTRDFKRRIRAVMFYTKKLFKLGKEEEAKHMINVFNGLMGFTQTETISESLAKQILQFREFLLQRKILKNKTSVLKLN